MDPACAARKRTTRHTSMRCAAKRDGQEVARRSMAVAARNGTRQEKKRATHQQE